jgi:hypothetical protein
MWPSHHVASVQVRASIGWIMNKALWLGLVVLLTVQILIADACHLRWPDANVPLIAVLVIGGSARQFVIHVLGQRR